MPILTIKAKITGDAKTEAVIRDAMRSATKLYNGLLWHLRHEFETTVVEIDESYSSQTCHACGVIKKSNRKRRGLYTCACGWAVQADVNRSLNQYERYTHVSPIRSSGCVAQPVVLPLRLSWHTVYEPASRQGGPSIY